MYRPSARLWIFAILLALSGGTHAQENPNKELVVCLMGDPQLIMVQATPRNVEMAMDDLSAVDHDFLAVLGDLAQNRAHFYKDYKEAVLEKAVRPVLSLAGNGDVGAGLDAYREATGLPLYYSLYRRGIRFIFMSTIYFTGEHNHICHLGYDQVSWLRNELKSDTLTTTVIFSHPPIFETTYHSEERDHLGAPGSMYLAESLELREMFRMFPNVRIFAHGHLHHAYDIKDELGRGTYFREGDLLHISVGATANNRGSSFLFFDNKKITVKVRDHEHHAWRHEHEYVLDLPTTLRDSEGETDSEWQKIRNRIYHNRHD
jgi:3',5'-cyclic AMP phosphodiesterase CpdA